MHNMTPLTAIHLRCVDCASDPGVDGRMWKHCPFDGEHDTLCALWAYRGGHNPRRSGIGRRGGIPALSHSGHSGGFQQTGGKIPCQPPDAAVRAVGAAIWRKKCHPKGPLAAIRQYCLWCCLDQAKEVRLCPSAKCPFHPYRLGKKPKLAGRACTGKPFRTEPPFSRPEGDGASSQGQRYLTGTPDAKTETKAAFSSYLQEMAKAIPKNAPERLKADASS